MHIEPLALGRRLAQLGAISRQAIAGLMLSAAGLLSLVVHEGYTARAVPDPVKGTAVPTIGFGSTGPDVKMGDTTAPVPALQRTLRDVQQFEGALKRCVHVPLTQYEYDAYVNLAYNIGPVNFCTNPKTGGLGVIPRHLNAEDYRGACDAILQYRYAGKTDCSLPANAKVCGGLWKRRQDLHTQCLGKVA